jgi:glycosyltransferase involved in cell wall biosynthesis
MRRGRSRPALPSSVAPPQVTAVIPTYNRASLVPRAVASALAQTSPPSAVIVVDDGSTDETRAVLEAFAGRITYLRQPNGGASAARNAGVAVATTPWVAFLDSDDVWAPQFLERVSEAIDATAGAALAYFTDLAYTDGRRDTLWTRSGFSVEGPSRLLRKPSDWIMRPIQPIAMQATVIAREAWVTLGGQDPAISTRHDTDLFFKLGFAGPGCAVAMVGATLTGDAAGDRLTMINHTYGRPYWEETVRMYRRLARGAAPRRHRHEFRARLANAHWRLARVAWSEGNRLACSAQAARSLKAAPGVPLRAVLNRLGSRPAA